MKNKRSFYIALILLLGVALTIGYAVLSQTLKIKGNTSIASNSWIIYFDHLMERPGTLEATVPAKINAAKDRIDFTITLDKPGDNYTFETDIINDGTIDAMIDSVSLSGLPSSLNNIVEWKVTYLDGTSLQKCDELLSKTKRRIRVVVNYNKDIDSLPDATDMELSLEVHYVQLDNTECSTTNPSTPDPIDPNDGRYTLTVDPNYGIYNGTDAPTIVRMVPGEVYVFGADPIHDQHTFTGWTVDSAETYNETAGIITMDEEDITAIAGWTEIVDEETDLPNCFRVDNSYFRTFNSALNSISDEGTIYLISNSCTISDRINIPEGKNITFDLNGHQVIDTNQIYNLGVFTITDSSKRNSGLITTRDRGDNSPFIYNYYHPIENCENTNVSLINARIIDNSNGATIDSREGNVFVNGGEYTTLREFVLLNGIGSASIENSTITIDGSSIDASSGSLSALQVATTGINKVVFVNNKVQIIQKMTSVYAIYFNNSPDYAEIHDIDFDIELQGNPNSFFGIYLQKGMELDNINMYVHGTALGGGAGIQNETMEEGDLKVTNSSFKYDLQYVSSQLVGMTYFTSGRSGSGKTTLENVDLDINIAGGQQIYAMYGNEYDYTNGNVKINVGGLNNIHGLHCTSICNINNVNVDIESNGGGTIYGAYFDGLLNYNQGSVNVKANNVGTVYGLANYHSDGLVDNVDVSVESHGNGATLCGVYLNNGTYKNSTLSVINNGNKNWYYKTYGATLENVEIVDENG